MGQYGGDGRKRRKGGFSRFSFIILLKVKNGETHVNAVILKDQRSFEVERPNMG